MTAPEFREFLANFKAFMAEEDLPRIILLRVLLAKIIDMDEDQFSILRQTLMTIEESKRPSNKEEFNRIMKGF